MSESAHHSRILEEATLGRVWSRFARVLCYLFHLLVSMLFHIFYLSVLIKHHSMNSSFLGVCACVHGSADDNLDPPK